MARNVTAHSAARSPVRLFLAAIPAAVAFLVVAGTASAQESAGEVGTAVTTFGFGDWFGLGIRLALVIGVIWVAVRGMRWYVRRMNLPGRGGGAALEVLETHALGPNRSLHLVRLGDRAVLIGATPERITQLLTVDDPEELHRLVDRPEPDTTRVSTRSGAALPAARSVLSVVAALRLGLTAMRRQRAASVSRRLGRSTTPSAPDAGHETDTTDAVDAIDETAPASRTASRLAAFQRSLNRSRAPQQPVADEEASTARRPSLFDRTLAEADAIEQARQAPSAAGLAARSGYARAASADAPDRPTGADGAGAPRTAPRNAQRSAQIAELQRAIAAARKQAG